MTNVIKMTPSVMALGSVTAQSKVNDAKWFSVKVQASNEQCDVKNSYLVNAKDGSWLLEARNYSTGLCLSVNMEV